VLTDVFELEHREDIMSSIFGAGFLAIFAVQNLSNLLLLAAVFFLGRMLWKLPHYAAHNGRFARWFPKLAKWLDEVDTNNVKHFAVTAVVCGLVYVIFSGYNIFTHQPSTWFGWVFSAAYLVLIGNGIYHLSEDAVILWNSKIGLWARRNARALWNANKNTDDSNKK
jgi:hypothetical protein